jgi:predicted nucleic acid-binding protein
VTGWLLDTNILSELRRPKPERKVLAFVAAQPLELLYISAVTLAEIRFGIEVLPEVARRSELNYWLAHKVRPMFEQRVLAITEDIMFKWRLLVEEGRKVGHTFSQPDSIIAATGQHHGLTIVWARSPSLTLPINSLISFHPRASAWRCRAKVFCPISFSANRTDSLAHGIFASV